VAMRQIISTNNSRREGRDPHPSAAIMDAQSVKTVDESARISGFDAHKCVKGRKRHLLVDTLGLPLMVYVTPRTLGLTTCQTCCETSHPHANQRICECSSLSHTSFQFLPMLRSAGNQCPLLRRCMDYAERNRLTTAAVSSGFSSGKK
jgi:hypothetical protein